MPRINRDASDVADYREPEAADFYDTADRQREPRMRGSMHESRESEVDARNTPRMSAADHVYKLPTNLDAPTPRAGYIQRWVRANFRTENDNLNWQSKMREGWTPRDPSTVPEHESHFAPTRHMDKAVISVGGLILMEIAESKLTAKRRFIAEKSRTQEKSVIQELDKVSREGRGQDEFGPLRVEEDREVVRTGRRPATMA